MRAARRLSVTCSRFGVTRGFAGVPSPSIFDEAGTGTVPGKPEGGGEFSEPISKPLSSRAAVNSMASRKSTPLSLHNMYLYALSGNNNSSRCQRLRNAQFLHRELAIRIAQRAKELEDLPGGMAGTQHVQFIRGIYEGYVDAMLDHPPPTTKELDSSFTELLRGMVLNRDSIPHGVNLGLLSLKDDRRETLSRSLKDRIDEALYKFFMARVGLRFLTEHHIACDPNTPNSKGLIDNKCDPVKECEAVIVEVRKAMLKDHGACPDLTLLRPILRGKAGKGQHNVAPSSPPPSTITYVPTHLRYMLTELLMNSSLATIRAHSSSSSSSSSLPPVTIVVVFGDEDLTIKVSDRAAA